MVYQKAKKLDGQLAAGREEWANLKQDPLQFGQAGEDGAASIAEHQDAFVATMNAYNIMMTRFQAAHPDEFQSWAEQPVENFDSPGAAPGEPSGPVDGGGDNGGGGSNAGGCIDTGYAGGGGGAYLAVCGVDGVGPGGSDDDPIDIDPFIE